MKFLLSIIISAVIFSGCGKGSNDKTKSSGNEDVSKYSGSFQGVLPCADCEGISYEITLDNDKTFSEKIIYLGKNSKPILLTGMWDLTDDGKVEITQQSGATKKFQLNEGKLEMLDKDGKSYGGGVNSKFLLKPFDPKNPPATDSTQKSKTDSSTTFNSAASPKGIDGKWKLISINGKSPDIKEFSKGAPELDIRENDNKFSGNTGCNNINGAAEINGNYISFAKYVTTRMSCPGNGEQEFIDALRVVDSYKIEKGKLLLISDKKTVIMEFVR